MSAQKYANDVYFGLTKPVRVLFPPKLDKPQKIDDRGDPKYEIQIGFEEDHPEFRDQKAAVAKIAREKFGQDVDIRNDLDLKFKSGDEEYEAALNHPDPKKRKEYPQLKGLTIMKLRTAQTPSIFDIRRRDKDGKMLQITDPNEIKNLIYAGCYVALKLTYATYDRIDRNTKPGVTAYPEQICFVCDGDRLGGASSKTDGSAFEAVQGAISDEDPTGGESSGDPY